MSTLLASKKNIFLRNTLFNYIGMVWMGGGIILVIPIYIKMLSPEGWGIVSACLSIQAMLLILDAGCSQIMPRDIAKSTNPEKTFASYFWIYMSIALLGILLLLSSAKWLSHNWFNAGSSSEELELCIRILAVQFFFQFSNNINIGYWNGKQRQFNTNLSQVTFFTCKHTAALLLLLFTPKPVMYISAYSAITLIEFIFNFFWIVKYDVNVATLFNSKLVKNIKKILKDNYIFSFGVIFGVFVSQLDKILLSHSLDTRLYGVYIIVAQLGLSFLQLQYPLMKALLPALSNLGSESMLKIISLKKMVLIIMLLIIPIIIAMIFSSKILSIWTHNDYIVKHGAMTLSLICFSVLINIPYTFIYTNLVRMQAGKVILCSNIISALAMFALFKLVNVESTIVIGGMMWIMYASISFLIGGTFVLLRK
ncbi:TPA: O90/O127 family O-antigen flippase [Salmonella bongori]|nr:O90/O127 family O-antigen flippase [Salmonella bongori]